MLWEYGVWKLSKTVKQQTEQTGDSLVFKKQEKLKSFTVLHVISTMYTAWKPDYNHLKLLVILYTTCLFAGQGMCKLHTCRDNTPLQYTWATVQLCLHPFFFFGNV